MSISVVIPAYNASPYIRETIQSILHQSLPADEILVIDDGSRDDTAAIAETFGPPVRVFRRPNAKQAVSRNFGIQEATGEWIAFMDSDDLWEHNKLERQMDELAKHPEADICYTGRIDFIEEQDGLHFDVPMFAPPVENIRDFLYRKCTFFPSSVIVRRSALVEMGGFCTDPGTAEDWDLWIRLLHAGKKFAVCPEPLLLYRLHLGSTSTNGMHMLNSGEIVFRKHVLPHLPAWYRGIALTRFLSEHKASTAYIWRRNGDPRCASLMAMSILHWPFSDWHRYKVLAHMLMTRFTVGFGPKVSHSG